MMDSYNYNLMILIDTTADIIKANLRMTAKGVASLDRKVDFLQNEVDIHAKQLAAHLFRLDASNAHRDISWKAAELEEQASELRGLCLPLVETNYWKTYLQDPTQHQGRLVIARLLFPTRFSKLPNFFGLTNDAKIDAMQGWHSLCGLFETSECLCEGIDILLANKICAEE